jgi:ribosomal protein S18 acetylase RimI-like enzyme
MVQIGTHSTLVEAPNIEIRPAKFDDIQSVVALHQEAFADKFSGAFGVKHIDQGAEALATAWRRQGPTALRGMFVAALEDQVIGTVTLRTWEMGSDDSGGAELAFYQVLGTWKATRSIFALSLLNHPVERHESFLTDVAVLEPYRRRGIAQALLMRAEEEARLRRKRYLSLYVSAANAGAHRLYQRLGFVDDHVRQSWMARFLFGQRSWIFMRKTLEDE